MSKLIKSITSIILIQVLFSLNIVAQLQVSTVNDANILAQTLGGPGVVVSNAFLTCPDSSSGIFSNGNNTSLSIAEGVILTSGNAIGVAGPNTEGGYTGNTGFTGTGYYYNAPGDSDLDQIAGVLGTNDACGLEFDISTGCADTISFNYVFGSEEYLEFVNSFNDVFALFVSGPNPAGGMYVNQNVAIVPGTANTVVSINNVNDVVNSAYYINNGDGMCYGYASPVECTDSFYIQYDGLTTVLEAKFAITPFASYHLKIVVADDLDGSLDSGVFIEAGSISASTIEINTQTDVQGYDNLVEGCVNGIIDLALLGVDSIQSDTVCINLEFSGTAVNGVDYVELTTGLALDSIICLYPGDTAITITLQAIADGLNEGTETLIIQFISDTCGFAAPPLELEIIDNINLSVAFTDSSYCVGQSIQLMASGAQQYVWTPNIFINNDTISNPIVNPNVSTIYTVTGNIGPCTQDATVNLNLFDAPIINLADTITICNSLPVVLDASTSIGADIVQWSPILDLNDATILNPTATPISSTWFFIEATNLGDCPSYDSVFVEIVSQANADAGLDQLSCNGSLVNLTGSGATELNWLPNTGLSCYDCANPTFTGTATTEYILTASYAGGQCADTDTVLVEVFGVEVDAGPDFVFCNNGAAAIGPENPIANVNYLWLDNDGNTYNVPNPIINIAIPNDSTSITNTLTLTITSMQGCSATDQIFVTALADPYIFAGENDTIFEGNNTILTAGGAGNSAFYNWEPADLILGDNGQIVNVSPAETTTFTAFGTTEDGCTGFGTVTVVVQIVPEIIMPTAFSPNGDGQNDFIKPFYIDIDEMLTFQIYNRWGTKVFEAKGDFNAFWDGTLNGKLQEVGVYIYFIEGTSKKLPQNVQMRGNISLIK